MAENVQKALDGEFYFFAKVFGFEPADKGTEVSSCSANQGITRTEHMVFGTVVHEYVVYMYFIAG